MSILPPSLTNPFVRQWALQVIGIVLLAGLLAFGIWLYYKYKITQLEQRVSEPHTVLTPR